MRAFGKALFRRGEHQLQVAVRSTGLLQPTDRLQNGSQSAQIIRAQNRFAVAGDFSIGVKNCFFPLGGFHGVHVSGKQQRASRQLALYFSKQVPSVAPKSWARVVLFQNDP